MTNITAKTLEIKLKAGATSEDLAAYYECTPEYLQFAIRQYMSEKAADIYIKKIAKNDRAAKRLNRSKQTVTETLVEEAPFEEPIEEVTVEEVVVETSAQESVEETPEVALEVLKSQLADLKACLNEKELAHRNVEAERHSIRCELQTHKESLTKILEQVELEEEAITSFQERIFETSDRMVQLNCEINSIREEISETEERIHELESISVLVYDSGILESPVAVPENWVNLFSQLACDETLGDFKGNQLRGLAKAKALKDAHPELTFEFVFETQALESFL